MKNFTAGICLLIASCLDAQDRSAVFSDGTLVYYGLDFSKAKLVGDFGNGSGMVMRDKMFPEWNEVIVNEPKKYDLATAFRKSEIYYDMEPVAIQNSKADHAAIRILNESAPLSPENIKAMVREFPSGEKKSGTALVLIVESFNKRTETAIVHVTLFDIASKQVLLTDKMMGAPHGVGLKNYWANSIHYIIESIITVQYNKWRRNAGQ